MIRAMQKKYLKMLKINSFSEFQTDRHEYDQQSNSANAILNINVM